MARAKKATTRGRKSKIPAKNELLVVTLVPVGGVQVVLNMPKESDVADTLKAGGFPEDTEVRSNGAILDSDHYVKNKDVLVLVTDGKIEAGN